MRFETRREKEIRIRKQKRSSIFGLVSAFGVVLVLAIVLWNSKQSLQAKNLEYDTKKAELQQQITDQQERTQSLEDYKKYIQTKKFVEEVAKEKFGLIYPDELMFKAEDKS